MIKDVVHKGIGGVSSRGTSATTSTIDGETIDTQFGQFQSTEFTGDRTVGPKVVVVQVEFFEVSHSSQFFGDGPGQLMIAQIQ